MTMLQRIESDRDTARRESRSEDTAFYSYLIAKSREPGKNQRPSRDSTDAEVVSVVRKLIKENEESLALIADHGAERLRWQNKLLQCYLPNQLSDDRLTEIIRETIEHLGQPKSKRLIGLVMNRLKTEFSGQYSSSRANQIFTNLIEHTD